MFTLRFSVVVPVLALLLSACGNEPVQSTDASADRPDKIVIEGRAHQGRLQSARVAFFKLDGDIRRRLGAVSTNDQGDFAVTLDRPDAPLLLEVTAANDGSSSMVCGALDGCGEVAFGDTRPMPENFRLTTVVLPDDLDGRPVAITPLTHLATGWARAMPGAVDAQSVHLARGRVAGLMHLTPDFAFQRVPQLTGDNAQVSDSPTARHALMAVAFAERAAESSRSIQRSLDGHMEAFISHGGQLRREGDYSLRGVLASAGAIASERSILPRTRSTLRVLVASSGADDDRLAAADPVRNRGHF